MSTKLGHAGYATILWAVADAWLDEGDLPDRVERWVDSTRSTAAVHGDIGHRDEADQQIAIDEAATLVLGAALLMDRAADVLEAAGLDPHMIDDLSGTIEELDSLLEEITDTGPGEDDEVPDAS